MDRIPRELWRQLDRASAARTPDIKTTRELEYHD